MDFRLLTPMLDEARLGNRVDGSWTTQAYSNIVESLKQSGLIGITKNNVKNRQKILKDKWCEVHDLFSGLSGFAWDESTKRFMAEPEACMNISTQSLRVDLNDNVDYIPEEQSFHQRFDATYRSPPHMNSYSPGDGPGDGTQSVPSAASGGTGGTSSSRGTKRKAPMVDVMDVQFDKLTTKLDVFVDYLGQGNALTQKLSDIVERQVLAIERRNEIINEQVNVMRRTSTFQHSELDILDILVNMNLQDEQIMVQCYDHLCSNPLHVRQLFGLPPHLRLNQLLKLIRGSG
ncbi:hypothetical protein Fmac_027576 [Flemingia macrophylla]|uniref:Myb/SANT-like domain-containing protein n=1 Tax=Flemingia macrophylla TaxID=520843 RepID=A0ABD1LI54_9FABA